MSLREYYLNDFCNDIKNIKFQHGNRVTNPNDLFFNAEEWIRVINLLPNDERKAYFIYSMFVTVASDQTMYTYYRDRYEEFRKKTRYPKYGYCCLGPHNNNPLSLIAYPIQVQAISRDKIEGISEEAAKLFNDEILDFFKNYMNDIDTTKFIKAFLNDTDIKEYCAFNNFIDQIKNNLPRRE